MIVDVDLNTIKKLGMTQNGFLLYEGKTTYHLYYANQGPIVFRTIIKKDSNSLAFLMSIDIAIKLLTPLKDGGKAEVVKLDKKIEKVKEKIDDIFKVIANLQ